VLGLKSIQLGSNLTALDVLITERNATYQETLDLWQAGSSIRASYLWFLTLVVSFESLQRSEGREYCQEEILRSQA
jgi:hypothetical protein